MEQQRPATGAADPLDNSMYRVAHLHGTELLMLRAIAEGAAP